ncbi:uncharacterized protein LOC144358015 [Saccoglossus kowalevskii]
MGKVVGTISKMAASKDVKSYCKNQFTPMKIAQAAMCISCGKSPKGHLRLLGRNAALAKTYMDLLKVLDIKVDLKGVKIYLCDGCINLVLKIRELKDSCSQVCE